MNNQELVIFIIPKTGEQIFFVCPPTIMSFWEDYVSENKNTNIEVLSQWIDAVPPVMRSKIKIYKGEFIDYKKVTIKKGQNNYLTIHSTLPKSDNFNPVAVARTFATGATLHARGMN